MAEIHKMLVKSENIETSKQLSEGAAGYAYMEIALGREIMRTLVDTAKFGSYAAEKAYYQSLLNEADGVQSAGIAPRAMEHYEYKRPDGGDVDRESVKRALASVQSRIDSLINSTEVPEYKNKTDIKTYNKCAGAFAAAFGGDASEFVLSEDGYGKLFGNIAATEETYLQKCGEKTEALRKCYGALKSRMESSLKRTAESGGSERAEAVKNAVKEAYGNSFEDILKLLAELRMTDEDEKAE